MKWPSVALADVCEINVGRTPSRNEPDYWKDGVHPWASISDLGKQRFLHDTKERFSDRALRECNMRSAHPGTVLFSFKLSIGKVGIATREMFTNEAIAALPPKDDNTLYAPYLAYALEAIDFSDVGSHAVMGRTLNKKSLAQIEIPLPPLEEQKRIAAILDQADALRRLRRRALDRLNTLGQAIFHDMFGDVVTNPKQWESASLGELCEVGSSRRVFVEEFVANGVPFYRGTEVGQLGAGGDVEPTLFISPDHYDQLIQESGKPEVGDLLLPSICHDGRIWNVNHASPFYFKDGRVLWIKSSQSANINSEYLRNYLRGLFMKRYSSIASGTTFAELKIVNLKSLTVLCPPMSLQDDFSSRMIETERRRTLIARSLSASEALFTSLQHRAFRGEL